MARQFQGVSQKAGLSPGTPVFLDEKKAEEISITVIEYDGEHFSINELDGIEECFTFKNSPGVVLINVDGLHEISVIHALGTMVLTGVGMLFYFKRKKRF